MNKSIGIDIDLTIVDIATPWHEYMQRITGHTPILPEVVDYNLTKYYTEAYLEKYPHIAPEKASEHLFNYWNSQTLYDTLKPLEGVTETLRAMSNRGWNIVFASYSKKGHYASKYNFLTREFPFLEFGKNAAFMATKEKGYVMCDVFVDDRHSHLNQFKGRDEVLRVLYDTPYTQCQELQVDCKVMSHWDELDKIVLESN